MQSPIRASLDAGYAFGTATDRLGTIDVRVIAGGAAVGVVFDARPFAIDIGPRLEVGLASGTGNASDSATRSANAFAPVVVAELAAEARLAFGQRWWLSLGLDGGAVLAGLELRSDTRRAGGIGGLVGGARVAGGVDIF